MQQSSSPYGLALAHNLVSPASWGALNKIMDKRRTNKKKGAVQLDRPLALGETSSHHMGVIKTQTGRKTAHTCVCTDPYTSQSSARRVHSNNADANQSVLVIEL